MKIWTKGINWILAALLGLLGFAGCEKASAPEYGLPLTEYGKVTVKGTVVDKATGKPIRGIRVGYSPAFQYALMYGVPTVSYQPLAHTLTGITGAFRVAESVGAVQPETTDVRRTVLLFVEDVDGAANGSFNSEQLEIDVEPNNTATVKVELTETE